MAYAAFDGVREREKAGWTNDLHYPIDVKITRRNKLAVGEKGLSVVQWRVSLDEQFPACFHATMSPG